MTRHGVEFLRAVERLAVVLAEAGMGRMAARVYAFMLIDGDGPYSAAELGETLRVSAAAISGAVGSLARASMLRKERAPGSRAAHYRPTLTNVETVLASLRADQLLTWQATLDDAAQILGPRTRQGRRLRQAAGFLASDREQLLSSLQK